MPVNCEPLMTLETLVPNLSARKNVSFRTLQQQYGDGYMARRQDGLNPINITWTVSTPPLSIENCQALEAELTALGPNPFLWTEPNGTQQKWILDPVQWNWNYQTAYLAELSFTLRRWYE